MKITRKKNDTSTIRTIWNDDKTKTLGVVGTIGDLMSAKILTYCDWPDDRWVFIPYLKGEAKFGKTRDDVISFVKE